MTDTTNPETLADRLRSDDAQVVSAALEEVYEGESVLVLKMHATGCSLAHTEAVKGQLMAMFTAIVWAAQLFAGHCGIQLNWIQDPEAQQDKLVVPPGVVPGPGMR